MCVSDLLSRITPPLYPPPGPLSATLMTPSVSSSALDRQHHVHLHNLFASLVSSLTSLVLSLHFGPVVVTAHLFIRLGMIYSCFNTWETGTLLLKPVVHIILLVHRLTKGAGEWRSWWKSSVKLHSSSSLSFLMVFY